MGCSLFFNTVAVEIPKDYQGWCFVIPVKDTTGFNFEVSPDGIYKVNKDGVVYVPASLMKQEEDLHVKIYQAGNDITNDVRYFSRAATSNTIDKRKYSYVQFLVPTDREKKISATDAYWRENYSKRQEGIEKFDSLLATQCIVFK